MKLNLVSLREYCQRKHDEAFKHATEIWQGIHSGKPLVLGDYVKVIETQNVYAEFLTLPDTGTDCEVYKTLYQIAFKGADRWKTTSGLYHAGKAGMRDALEYVENALKQCPQSI